MCARAGTAGDDAAQRDGPAFHDLPVALVQIDRGGRILRANGAAARLLEAVPADLPGASLSAFASAQDSPTLAAELAALDDRRGEPREWDMHLAVGDAGPVEVAVRGVCPVATGEPLHLLVLLEVRHGESREQLLLHQRQLRSLAARLLQTAEEERRRLARDLHDSIGESLSVLELHTAILANSPLTDEQGDIVVRVRDQLEVISEEIGSLVFRLNPPVLQQVGLPAALRWLVGRLEVDHGLRVTVRDEGTPSLSQPLRGFLFRAVRELLHNVAKHAETDTARVALASGRGGIQVRVEDDGCGFDRDREAQQFEARGSFGLFSLREEVSYMGGRLDLDTAPNRGTRVEIWVPADREQPS